MFVFHSDPGHGWLEVPMGDLEELGIDGEITPYSYRNGDTAYLEEDCDAGTFFRAYKDRHGKPPEFVEEYRGESPVRSYPHYYQTQKGV